MKLTRRNLLISAGSAAIGAASVSPAGAASSAASPRKIKVVVAGGHPGDPEYGCGGTNARLTSLGHQGVLLYLNDGAWPPTPAATRIAEASKACALLHAAPAYAGQVNGHAVVDNAHYE